MKCQKLHKKTSSFVRVLMLTTAALAFAPELSFASPMLQIPNARGGFNSDEVATSSGVRCRQSVDSPMSLDMGVVADGQEAGVYGRVTIPLGAPKRIDCNRLYDLEIQRLEAEIQSLRGGNGSPYVVD